MPSLFNRISAQERLLFTRHLSVLVKSGIPIAESIESLLDQTRSSILKKVLNQVLSDIQNGESLAQSLAKHPQIFDNFYISLIKIGENSGKLEENLIFLATQLNKDYTLKKKIQGALLYPGVVLAATAVVGFFIALFILPQLVDFFQTFDAQLPLTTRVLLFFANLMKNFGIFIGLGLAGFIFFFLFIINTPPIKPLWHRFTLSLPLIGPIIKSVNLARFSRNLGTMLASGIPINDSLNVVGRTLNNHSFSAVLDKALSDVEKGNSLAGSLKKSKLFPSLTTKMIAVGEKSGQLEESLLYLSEFYEDELDETSKNLSTILEPVLLIFIGLVVGFVAMAIISPIYELTGSLRR